jgi:hypothetical protein
MCEGRLVSPPAAAQILREQPHQPVAGICTEMKDNPVREGGESMIEKQAETSRR